MVLPPLSVPPQAEVSATVVTAVTASAVREMVRARRPCVFELRTMTATFQPRCVMCAGQRACDDSRTGGQTAGDIRRREGGFSVAGSLVPQYYSAQVSPRLVDPLDLDDRWDLKKLSKFGRSTIYFRSLPGAGRFTRNYSFLHSNPRTPEPWSSSGHPPQHKATRQLQE